MEKIRKDRQHSPVLVWLSLCKHFQGMRVFNSNWIWKMKYFRIFFFVSLYVALWIIETLLISITSASHLFHFQPSEQTIFLSQSSRLGHGTRPQRPQQTIRWVSDPARDQTMYQLSHQTIVRPDHQIRSAHRLPSMAAPLQISTAHPTSWNGTGQVHCLWVGSRGVYKALDEPCKAYFPHTFGLKFSDIFSGLN